MRKISNKKVEGDDEDMKSEGLEGDDVGMRKMRSQKAQGDEEEGVG